MGRKIVFHPLINMFRPKKEMGMVNSLPRENNYKWPSWKVLVIGAGVAGLAAIQCLGIRRQDQQDL